MKKTFTSKSYDKCLIQNMNTKQIGEIANGKYLQSIYFRDATGTLC